MKVFGTVDFKGKYVDSENTRVPGKLLGPEIEGAKVKGLEELSVSGHTSLGDGLNVKEDRFLLEGQFLAQVHTLTSQMKD